MPTNANIGILVPGSYDGPPPRMDEFARFFRSAEELGFESVWVTDRIFHRINILDPFTLLACAAASTSTIRLEPPSFCSRSGTRRWWPRPRRHWTTCPGDASRWVYRWEDEMKSSSLWAWMSAAGSAGSTKGCG